MAILVAIPVATSVATLVTNGGQADVVILGGGIAGLWLLDCLIQAGYSAILLNKGPLGQGQSIAAQGIIHGGTKYFGATAVSDLAAMPARWQASLRGEARPDLRTAPPLAPAMQMWLPRQLGGAIMAGFAKKAMHGTLSERPSHERPSILPQGPGGRLFDVDEIVVDPAKVLGALRDLYPDHIRCLSNDSGLTMNLHDDGYVDVDTDGIKLRAQRVVLTSGVGNEALLNQAGIKGIPCQRRPLRQIMLRGMTQAVYLHCIGKNPKPLATITSHPDQTGGYYWYMGGLLAEQGADQTPEVSIKAARRQLHRLLPGADYSRAKWATHRVDRAEPGGSGLLPGSAMAVAKGPVIVGWPTKLALAPVLADKIMTLLQDGNVTPGPHDTAALTSFTAAPATIAKPPWELVDKWN